MPRHSDRRRLITRGGRRLASFTFRARGPEGPNACTLLDLPASATTDGQQISIEPFRPVARSSPAIDPGRSKELRWADVVAQPTAEELKSTSSAPAASTKDLPAPKYARGPDGERIEGVDPLSGKVSILEQLGLLVRPVPKDGACALHSLAFHLKRTGRDNIHDVAALRAQLCDHLAEHSDKYESMWDRLCPAAQPLPCSSWSEYVAKLRAKDAWLGELDLMALADIHGLRIIVMRPE